MLFILGKVFHNVALNKVDEKYFKIIYSIHYLNAGWLDDTYEILIYGYSKNLKCISKNIERGLK